MAQETQVMKLIKVQSIILDHNVYFEIVNTVGKRFGVIEKTKIEICDKEARLDQVIHTFRSTKNLIAEIEFLEGESYILKHINFLTVE